MAVAFRRVVKRGSKGNDAFAIKRALKRKGFGRRLTLTGPRRYLFGSMAEYRLKQFQKKYGVRADGVYGKTTHGKFVNSNAFDTYGKWLMAHAPVPTTSNKRSIIVATALFGARNRYSIHYTQSRARMYGVRNKIRPPRIPYYEDCSSFATWCYWVAGAPDPNGLDYNGYGFTGTQISHGRRVSSPRPGDLIFYGRDWRGNPTHVAIYIGGGKVVSHGGESGPVVSYYKYRPINQIRSYLP